MYSALIDYLNGWDLIRNISQLECNCCESGSTNIISNRLLNDNLHASFGEPNRIILDGMFFPYSHTLLFVDFINWSEANGYKMFVEKLDAIYRVVDRIAGTIALLNRVVVEAALDHSFRDYHNSIVALPINSIIISNISFQEYTVIRLANFDKLRIDARKEVIGETILKSCEEFEREYAKR